MELNEKDIALIDEYILGNLEENDKESFEKRLSQDKEFYNLYLAQCAVIESINRSSISDLRSKMNSWHDEIEKKPKNKTLHFKWIYYSAAASVLIALFFMSQYFFFNSSTKIFEENFSPYQDIITVRGSDPNSLQEAMEAYNHENYTLAVQKFESIIQEDEENTIALFYNAVSYLAVKNTQNAIPLFEKIINKENRFNIISKWYLGLCYVLNNDVAKAKKVFEDLASRNSSYSQKAQVILNDL